VTAPGSGANIEDMECVQVGILGLVAAAGFACSSPGASHATTDADPLELQLDCSPRVTDLARFEGACQYVGGDVPIMECPQTRSAPGSLRMTVPRPQDVTAGARIAVGGADPIVTIEAAATAGNLLVQSTSVGGVGYVVFDRFVPGTIMSGAFVDTSIEMRPDSAFSCHLSSGHFDASTGPGVTAP
jgi:hypothetical protein